MSGEEELNVDLRKERPALKELPWYSRIGRKFTAMPSWTRHRKESEEKEEEREDHCRRGHSMYARERPRGPRGSGSVRKHNRRSLA